MGKGSAPPRPMLTSWRQRASPGNGGRRLLRGESECRGERRGSGTTANFLRLRLDKILISPECARPILDRDLDLLCSLPFCSWKRPTPVSHRIHIQPVQCLLFSQFTAELQIDTSHCIYSSLCPRLASERSRHSQGQARPTGPHYSRGSVQHTALPASPPRG